MQAKGQKPSFEYPEDERFFVYLLGEEAVVSERFDFNEPKLKRTVFNRIRKKILQDMVSQGRTKCELHLLKDCTDKNLVIDHIIPLSTNELNKHLRKMPAPLGKKIQRQSFGSNHPSNFLIACGKCNNHKKHRFIKREGKEWKIVDLESISTLF